jgi:poly-beta-1,6-N-acetyl-D-glucosamine biosynthesis protein PgaD
MIELKPTEWPPLIQGADLPAWVRVRDVVLTLLAWLLLAWVLREGLELTIDYLSPPRFQFTNMSPPNLIELAARLSGFLLFIGALVAWLLFWAAVRGHQLRASEPVAQPPGLPLADQAADFALAPQEVAPWQRAKVLVVHFDDSGQVSHGDVTRPG